MATNPPIPSPDGQPTQPPPEIIPPPPIPTSTAVTFGSDSAISTPIVPCPAITRSSSKAWTSARP